MNSSFETDGSMCKVVPGGMSDDEMASFLEESKGSNYEVTLLSSDDFVRFSLMLSERNRNAERAE